MDSIPSPPSSISQDLQSDVKRRKIRKGTFSCWECKRRKMRCVTDSLDRAACNGCRRRGCPCVGQEVPEEPVAFPQNALNTCVTKPDYKEERSMQDNQKVGQDRVHKKSPASYIKISGIHRPAKENKAGQSKDDRLSRQLYDSLPPREELERICEAIDPSLVLAHEVLTLSYATIVRKGIRTSGSLLEVPGPNVHPVLMARYMLQLALFFQSLCPDLHERISGLPESPRATMERVADLAIRLVVRNDEFLGSLESLECVLLEVAYQANVGNLRQSFLTIRRAMGMAQLMGLHQQDSPAYCKVLDPDTEKDPQIMWFRIVEIDRYLCLMLGLPQGSFDRRMASEKELANDTPMGCLERTHSVIASRILERNESKMRTEDLALTRSLDSELQRAARKLPSKWWLVPDLAASSTNPQDLLWSMRRLHAQVMHYTLLNQLHVPYMLRSAPIERNHEYSQLACVNASRELLVRYITLRNFNHVAYSCRILDFLATMAAMTLLLAHLDGQHSGEDNLLAHQYLSDRAIIEQAQENMQELNRLNTDALSAQSADLLRRLLALAIETEDSNGRDADKISVHMTETETMVPEQDSESTIVTMHIPYFGVIKIARKGVSRELFKAGATTMRSSRPFQSHMAGSRETIGSGVVHSGITMHQPALPGSYETLNADNVIRDDADSGHVRLRPDLISSKASHHHASTQMHLNEHISPSTGSEDSATPFNFQDWSGLSNLASQHENDPGLIAAGDQWALQGVDMAFFNSLMNITGNDGVNWLQ